jgi:hypothetical protein
MSGSSQGIFSQSTKLPSATADSDAQVGLGIPSSFTKPSFYPLLHIHGSLCTMPRGQGSGHRALAHLLAAQIQPHILSKQKPTYAPATTNELMTDD